MASAGPILAAHLATEEFRPLQRKVVSTVTGKPLRPDTDLPQLLNHQITSPVRFMEAVTAAEAEKIELWIEVGPGAVLSRIMSEITKTPVISLDAGSDSLRGLLCAIAAAFALGHEVNQQVLFAGRFTRPFDFDWQPKFFVNPCELAPVSQTMKPLEPEVRNEELADNAPIEDIQGTTGEESETSVLELLTRLVAESAELPESAVDPESRLLSNLHLNSITVTRLIAEAARHLELSRAISPADFIDASLREIAQAFAEQLTLARDLDASDDDALPAGVDTWTQVFTVELLERKLSRPRPPNETGCWQVFAPPTDEFAETLRQKFADFAVGRGILICLPLEPDDTIVVQLLEAARLALAEKTNARLVLVQRRITAAAFVRTLHLEAPRVITCIVNIPPAPVSQAEACDWVLAEAVNAEGHIEVYYDSDGRRYEPVVRPLPSFDEPGDLPLSGSDVLVVTGGGKGITAECALSLAKECGAHLVLVGQSTPASDAELAANLKRMKAEGIRFTYKSVDVTDAAQVREMITRVEQEIGPVTGILHGAARNSPQLISNLDEESVRSTLAVKVLGAQNLLLAVDAAKLKLLVAFGSIIARTGLPGEADYGLANEWLTFVTEEWKHAHPECLCLVIEWSIWSGKGMGARLGRTDMLSQHGVTPISPKNGVAMLGRLLRKPPPSVSLVVMGRIRDLPAFKIDRTPLPFLRFLEQPRVFYPEIELVIDADLSTSTDPYLEDHVLKGDRLLPAVIGLEAISQAAFALTEPAKILSLENVRFSRPVIVPAAKPLKIRLAALRTGPNRVDVVLRSEETAFQVDHFQATCRVDEQSIQPESDVMIPVSAVALDPDRDLYGSILFQGGRFRRVKNYRLLRAAECIAEISSDENCEWFNHYLPPGLVLGDPGVRDAYIHAIQCCIPHLTLLPVAVDRVSIHPQGFIRRTLCPRERSLARREYVYLQPDGDRRSRSLA